MNKRTLFLLFLIGFFTLSCGGNGQEVDATENGEKVAKSQQLSRDTLRQLYQQLMAARTDSMPTYQHKEEGKLYPVDEAPLDTGFFVFRERLLNALDRHDVFYLLDVTSKDIKAGFGAENGLADFVSMWQLDSKQPDTLQIWGLLSRVLSEGGTFSDGRQAFQAPYYHSTWPSQYDPYEYATVSGAGVRFREAANLNSRILKTISHDIVKYLEEGPRQEIGGETHPWIKVEMLDGNQGYVYGKFIGRPIGFRAGFERRKEDTWQMVFFLAGD